MTQPFPCVRCRELLFLVALGFSFIIGLGANAGDDKKSPTTEVTGDQKGRVMKVIQASKASKEWVKLFSAQKLAVDAAGKPKEYLIYLEGMTNSSDKIYLQKAWAVEYRYNGKGPGITVRWTVGLGREQANDKSIEVEFLRNYPTPLADEEEAEAIKLARKNVLAVEDLFKRHEMDIEVSRTVTIIANPDDPQFGHRVVRLAFYAGEGPQASARVLVDLTTEEVEVVTLAD